MCCIVEKISPQEQEGRGVSTPFTIRKRKPLRAPFFSQGLPVCLPTEKEQ